MPKKKKKNHLQSSLPFLRATGLWMGLVAWSLIFSPLPETGSPGVAERGPQGKLSLPLHMEPRWGVGGWAPTMLTAAGPADGSEGGAAPETTVLPADGWLGSLGPFEALVPWKPHAYVVTLNRRPRTITSNISSSHTKQRALPNSGAGMSHSSICDIRHSGGWGSIPLKLCECKHKLIIYKPVNLLLWQMSNFILV